MILPSLYEHQGEFITEVRVAMRQHRNVIACGVTGFGKSRIAKWIMGSTLDREPTERQSGFSLFAVHRRGLVDNIHQVLDESPAVPHGIIMSGVETDHDARLQVASIDTLLSWYCEAGTYSIDRTFDLVVFDETHSHLSKLQTFLAAHDAKRLAMGLARTYVLGLSATPECKGISDTYRAIVQGPSPEWLQEHGYASRFRYLSGHKGRIGELVKQGGEFTKSSVDKAFDGLQGDFVRDWLKYADGRPTIGFFPRLSHAREAQQILHAAGIQAEYVDGETPDDQRRNLYKGLTLGWYPYLVNVGVVERGTDIPTIGVVQLCTAIGSRVRYLQMIGRGARVADGKTDCLVLDHGGNVHRHGFWEDDIRWTLDMSQRASKEQGARPTIECPQCGVVYRGGKCQACGYEPTARERKAVGLEFDGRELKPYERKPLTPKQQDPEKVFVSCLYKAGYSGRTWKQAVGMYYGIMKSKGIQPRVPKRFHVGGREYESIGYGDPRGTRRVAALYDFIRDAR